MTKGKTTSAMDVEELEAEQERLIGEQQELTRARDEFVADIRAKQLPIQRKLDEVAQALVEKRPATRGRRQTVGIGEEG